METEHSKFLSTPSARRATLKNRLICTTTGISIHALREEGDSSMRPHIKPARYFYPRPPRGGRLGAEIDRLHKAIFLSTPSARRATIVNHFWHNS